MTEDARSGAASVTAGKCLGSGHYPIRETDVGIALCTVAGGLYEIAAALHRLAASNEGEKT